MTQFSSIPDPAARAKSIAMWRDACKQLDVVTLQLDELIAMIEKDLRSQRLQRLQGKTKV